ncbi:uncharacterized protein LOC110913885 [Helianthus annuus]|uniref:uncharacterized protein LOC110913885 n=1 Tax=Helianthus annuus TaxID=4232 RepID=UPI000B8F41BC|nr:uncharacterized protein LOC110913885 [Helianthus annuus]
MSKSEEVNNHPRERNDTTRINVVGADLQALIDNAVTRALDRQFKESSGTRSRTQSVPHTKPPSKTHASHKDDSHHSSNQRSKALAWWRSLIQATGKIPLYNLYWDQFVALIKENFCPQHEVEKIETDFLTLVMKNLDCQAYVTSFNTMSRLVPYLVAPEPKRIARFIGGLALEIKGNMKASRPTTYRSVVDLSLSLTLDAVRNRSAKASDEGKRKREDANSHRSDKKRKGNSEHKKGSGFKKDNQQSGEKPKCKTCQKHHFGKCRLESQSQSQTKPKVCGICKSKEHRTLDCKKLKDATCYVCNEKGHIRTNCPKNPKKPEEAKKTNARVFHMNAHEAVQNDNVITGTFLINDVYPRVLFDSGADKSFVDNKLCKLLSLPVKTLNIKYEVELADGTVETDSTILDGCFISIRNHSFPLSLLPLKLAGFDIGDTQYGLPKQVSVLKASRCLKKGCVIYMAQNQADHEKHLRCILELLQQEKLYAKFSKCEFWLREVQFLGHVVS